MFDVFQILNTLPHNNPTPHSGFQSKKPYLFPVLQSHKKQCGLCIHIYPLQPNLRQNALQFLIIRKVRDVVQVLRINSDARLDDSLYARLSKLAVQAWVN